MRGLCLLLAAAAPGMAQTAFLQLGGKPTTTVEGRVMNSVTGEPVVRAHVVLEMDGSAGNRTFGVLTDADGRFSIGALPPDSYSVRVTRVGFVDSDSLTVDAGAGAGDSSRAAPAGTHDLEVKLKPVGAVTGLVLDANGEPVEGASVVAEDQAEGKSTTTDEKGEFRIGGLHPGRYPVKAVPNELFLSTLPSVKEIRLDGSEELHHAPTYYPGSLTVRSAGRVAVTAGGETGGVVIRLIRMPIVRIGGTVTGAPAGGGNVFIEIRRGDVLVRSMWTRPDRSFEIWRLDPGQYSLTAEWYGSEEQHLQSAPAGIEIGDRNVDRLELRMVARSDVPGRVHFEDKPSRMSPDGKEQADRYVELSEVNGHGAYLAAIGPDDSFILKGVEPGRYRVAFSGRTVYAKSVELGQTHMEGGVLDLRYGSGGAALSIVASSAGGQISGKVRGAGNSSARTSVALLLDDGYPSYAYSMGGPFDAARAGDPFPRVFGIDRDGAYSFSSIPPGKYKLVVVEGDDFTAEDGMELSGGEAETVEVHAGDKLTKDLSLPASGR
ncbi:MAG TPA: carboxypeptidase-like regulatory domain-containing protein [Bryobacteraceae bacterium]|nr:carboxypeptidase-like regulatory domain-containing protein [Bryobacteraceae bacterium]